MATGPSAEPVGSPVGILESRQTGDDVARERERLEADILIVGGGPAGLSAAIRLGQLMRDPATRSGSGREPLVVLVEKGRYIGAHLRSGAVIDPRPFRELMPDFDERAPLEGRVSEEEVLYLTPRRALRFPDWALPPELKNEGNYVISLSKVARWMAEEAERLGVTLLTETSVVEPIIEDGRLVGVRTGPKGLDRDGRPRANYDPGTDIYAPVTILAEGAHGTVARVVIRAFGLAEGRQPMIYSGAVKEVIEVPRKDYPPGKIFTTLGYPARYGTFGGGFFYDMSGPYVAVGLIYSLDWTDPDLDLHDELQRWKLHPYVHRHLQGGRVVQYSACIIPEGGYYAIPRLYMPGGLLTGDSAGLVNVPRNKGIHLAVHSGRLAAEVAFAAWQEGDFSETRLAEYERRLRESWAWEELYRVRNFRQAFQDGFLLGLLRAGLYRWTGGRLFRDPLPIRVGHRLVRHGSRAPRPPVRGDGALILDKRSDIARGAPKYDEQPSHLRIVDAGLCLECQRLYDSPCTKFCPGDVFRWEPSEARIIVSHENCLHPKICEFACPYDNIRWSPPQGGDGPHYTLT
jgi:electron-transferring-flavoprotein dehydrogenase